METSRVNLTELGIHLETSRGHLVHMIDIPTNRVGMDWEPSPEEFDIVKSGDLENGMVIHILHGFDPRFMLVTDIDKSHPGIVTFTAVFADGRVEKNKGFGKSYRWAVLKSKNVILALTPGQVAEAMAEHFTEHLRLNANQGESIQTDIRPDDEQEFVPNWAGTAEIPAIDSMSDEEREWYLNDLNASSADKHAKTVVGPQTKTTSALEILDIIELFDTSYVVMDILHQGHGIVVHLRDLETRKKVVKMDISGKTEIKVLGSLV